VIFRVVLALAPYAPTTPVTVRTCTPTSLEAGDHENWPERLMLLLEAVPGNESRTEKPVGKKSLGFAIKVSNCPGETLEPGVSCAIARDGPLPTCTDTDFEAL
jgi:hypothetical protein